MIVAPTRDYTGLGASDSDACPRCGAASGTPTLLTSMTSYYACGSCETRWSVARNCLAVSRPRKA